MTYGFWKKLKRPFFALAPMADVTDAAFRLMIAKRGKPDVLWTEFVSAAGLMSKGRERLLIDLRYAEEERPIVAQLFGSDPEQMYECAKLVRKMKFDGLDINMGCPDRAIEKQGAGAALMKNPKLAGELIRAAKEGAGRMPVSVKTRIGYAANTLEEWIPILVKEEPAAITVHGRTRKEMSKVPARWEEIGKAALLVRKCTKPNARPLVIGNGDVRDLADGRKKAERFGVDGVMIGRGIFANPWLFSGKYEGKEVPVKARLRALVEHTRLFGTMFRGTKHFDIMKKHYKAYASGFDGAKELRIRLMGAKDAKEVEAIVKQALLTQM